MLHDDEVRQELDRMLAAGRGLSAAIHFPQTHFNFDLASEDEGHIRGSFRRALAGLGVSRAFYDGQIVGPRFLIYDCIQREVIELEPEHSFRMVSPESPADEIRSSPRWVMEADTSSALVSCEWPTPLVHYALEEMLFHGGSLICLTPHMTDAGLQLLVADPAIFATEAAAWREAHHSEFLIQ